VVAYMDVDLATGLDALLPLVAPILSGHSDVAIGTRLAPGSQVVRGPKRELISRGYNALVHAALGNGFSDAQCGFKAMGADVARSLLPLVEDDGWFFDTELLVLAERSGLRIHEVPVDWVDDPDSRVDIRRTAVEDLKGIWRLLRRPAARPPVPPGRPRPGRSRVARFASVGVASTAANLALFCGLRAPLGVYAANLVAVVASTVANTIAHRRVTFAEEGDPSQTDALLGGSAVLTTNLALTTAALAAVGWVLPGSVAAEVVAVLAATTAAATVRFAVLRAWIFRAHHRGAPAALGRRAPALPPRRG